MASWPTGDADDRRAAIGLDVDELHVRGERIPLTVRLRRVEADVRGVAVAAILRPVSGPAAAGNEAVGEQVRLTWDEATGCFVGEITPPGAGMFDLAVTAESVPGAGNLTVTELVAVVKP